ncbi:MAG: rhomboid family intramembrane serine protease [Alkalispirochaetaceae bacterium]
MKIRYNAPVTLTFALTATVILLLDTTLRLSLASRYFSIGATLNWGNLIEYPRLVLHILGHANWTHFMSNFAFILLLGPILEEKYGGANLLFMMIITALVTGLLNVALLPTGLLGASGIVFMMILLVSFTNIRQGEIPLTFILVVLIYLAREIVASVREDSISQFAHIVGGMCGGLFGFFRVGRRT